MYSMYSCGKTKLLYYAGVVVTRPDAPNHPENAAPPSYDNPGYGAATYPSPQPAGYQYPPQAGYQQQPGKLKLL